MSRLLIKLGYQSYQVEKSDYYFQSLKKQLYIDQQVKEEAIILLGSSSVERIHIKLKDYTVINYGIGTDTTLGLLDRISLYKSIKTAKLIFIQIGFNDLKFRNNISIFNNYEKIIDGLSNKSILISTILPVTNNYKNPGINLRVKELNTSIHKLGNKYDNVKIVNTAEEFGEQFLASPSKYYGNDGLHLAKPGNILIGKFWKESIIYALRD